MIEKPTTIEVLDREGVPVTVSRRARRRLPSLWNPLNWLLLLAAIFTAVSILFYAMTEVIRRRARGRDDA